jgi:hypothetical protein
LSSIGPRIGAELRRTPETIRMSFRAMRSTVDVSVDVTSTPICVS